MPSFTRLAPAHADPRAGVERPTGKRCAHCEHAGPSTHRASRVDDSASALVVTNPQLPRAVLSAAAGTADHEETQDVSFRAGFPRSDFCARCS